MKETIHHANLYAVNDLRYEETPRPVCGADEVLVEVKCCGICGSDMGRVYGKGTYHFPTVIGHEFSGRVAYDPRGELEGAAVTVFPLLPCFSCESCQKGSYATCENYDYYGSRRDGGMTEAIAVKRWNVLVMPRGLSFEEGAMCEPTSVARHAALKLSIQAGERVFVSGAGPIGLAVGQWAKSMGAAQVYYIDIDPRKIAFAEQLGFAAYQKGTVIDRALEGTGYSDALEACLAAVKPHGNVVLMGNPAGEIKLSQKAYWHILRKELHLAGTWNSSYSDVENDWKESLLAMAEGRINVKPLITHRYPLAQCNAAFEMMRQKEEFYSKVMLMMNEEK